MITYRLSNPRPPRCALCREQVHGPVATVEVGGSWYEGTPAKPVRRTVSTGDTVHEKCIPIYARERAE